MSGEGDHERDRPRLCVDGRLDPASVADLCERAGRLLRTCEGDLVVDLGGLACADGAAIEAAARLQLVARRLGRRIRLCDAGDEMRDLVTFCGLDGVLAFEPSAVEARGEPEQREQPVRVEEEADP